MTYEGRFSNRSLSPTTTITFSINELPPNLPLDFPDSLRKIEIGNNSLTPTARHLDEFLASVSTVHDELQSD